ncbi:MAG: LCP family protein [Ardenticatenaceae bacterium]|nr:LCP family protein [Ardenticatenaceae bacterium]
MVSDSQKRRSRSGIRLPLWALIIIALGLLAAFIAGSVGLFRLVQQQVMATGNIIDPDFSAVVEPEVGAPAVVDAPSVSVVEEQPAVVGTPVLVESSKPWDGTERVTVLMLGIDQRCDQSGPTHTDTMMLVTVDPVALSAAVLSLPRDLWVEIPGFGLDRINQANYLGEAYEYPGGGPALAVETVEATLGIPINYYVAVNFDAFVEVVDLIGGIEIDVPEAIDDPDYPDRCYGFDPFSIEAGTHQMDGTTALKYARTRATFGGDVDRAGRQQAVVLAVREQVLRLDMVPQLMRQAPELWQTFQNNVRTNMSVDEVLQLALLVQDVPREQIHTAVIDYNYVYNETTPDGRQVLVPIRDKIRQLRDDLFAPPAVPTPVIEDLPVLMAQEAARVAVYNGTAVFGLAGETQTYLQDFGFNITEVGNADAATYRTTQVIDYGSHPYTVQYLIQRLQIPPLNVSNGRNPDGDFDVLIILGDDWRVPGS